MRSVDEALDQAIRAGVRITRESTPASLGLTDEEAKEWGKAFVRALLARQRVIPQSLASEHAPDVTDVTSSMVQVKCSCDWHGAPAGRYEAYEEHARHRLEVGLPMDSRSRAAYRRGQRRDMPQDARGMRGEMQVQHPRQALAMQGGRGKRLLEGEMGPDRDMAPPLLHERRRAPWGSETEASRQGTHGAGMLRAQDRHLIQENDGAAGTSSDTAREIAAAEAERLDEGYLQFWPVPFTSRGMGT